MTSIGQTLKDAMQIPAKGDEAQGAKDVAKEVRDRDQSSHTVLVMALPVAHLPHPMHLFHPPPALLNSMPASSLHTLVALAAVADAFSPAAQTKPRHLVLIVADDLGYADLGYTGSEIRTPNIDGLANSGVDMFTELQPPYVRGTRTSRLRAVRTRGAGQLAPGAMPASPPAPLVRSSAVHQRRYAEGGIPRTVYPPRRTAG